MSTTYLVDTHVFLWLLTDPARIDRAVRDELSDTRNTVLVSAASAMEIATKTRLGKLAGEPVVTGWAATLAAIDARELPVTGEHAVLAGSFDWAHRDPFDRLLAAQAVREPAILVTRDPALLALPLVTTLQA